MRLTLTQIGNSTGAIFPKKLLEEMNLSRGDELYISRIPGGFAIRPYSEELDEQMKVARKGMAKYRNTLNKLADS